MIDATVTQLSDLITEAVMSSSTQKVTLTVESMVTATLPAAFKIETTEAQLQGPRGEAGGEAFTTDPLAYYLLARD